MSYGVKAFFIIGKGPHPAFAAAVLTNIRKILKLIRKNDEPFVARVYQGRDEVNVWITRKEWNLSRRS